MHFKQYHQTQTVVDRGISVLNHLCVVRSIITSNYYDNHQAFKNSCASGFRSSLKTSRPKILIGLSKILVQFAFSLTEKKLFACCSIFTLILIVFSVSLFYELLCNSTRHVMK